MSIRSYFAALFQSEATHGGRRLSDHRCRNDNDPKEVQIRGKEMALAYAQILLKEAQQLPGSITNNDTSFFEALQTFAQVVTAQFFPDQRDRVELELDRLFRTPGFNRNYKEKTAADFVPARQLWLRPGR